MRQSAWLVGLLGLGLALPGSSVEPKSQPGKTVLVKSYRTQFKLDEDPISEDGKWINGAKEGLDWFNVITKNGVAYGAVSTGDYTDPTALLAGTWGRNQFVKAKVFSKNQTAKYYQEVEIRLRSTLTAHHCTGYEVFWRCLKTKDAYVEIVRWNGKVKDWTSLQKHSGAQFGVKDGDVVEASIVGNVIKGYLNGAEVITATDKTYTSGHPGMGFNYGVGKSNVDFGFSSYEVESYDEAAPADKAFQPKLVTAETRADAKKLAVLEKPGKVFFEDGFESAESLQKYFEVRGLKEGRAKLVSDPKLAHSGKGAIQFTSPASNGQSSGAGASGWFGPDGYDRVYFRRYIKFADDYDQGNLNHTGGGLAAVAGADRWRAMGSAGIRPKGDDHFNSAFEPWRAWGRYPAPGYMFLYTYWMDMQRDPDGHFWGNMLGPKDDERLVLQRGRWYCLEHMIQVNDVGKANGELAAWIDGKLYIHYTGIRWRTSDAVKLKRFDLGVYVHQARKDNTVWYDDVALSTGYIGPTLRP